MTMAGYTNYYPSTRNRRTHRNRGRTAEQEDAIAAAITMQVVLCVLLIVAFVLYKKIDGESYQRFKAEYTTMTADANGSKELGALLTNAAQGVSAAFQSVEDYFAGLFGGLFGVGEKESPPEILLPEESKAEESPSSSAESEAAVGDFNYHYLQDDTVLYTAAPGGMGGQQPVSAAQRAAGEAPAGSSLSPIFVSGPVKPPVTGLITSPFGYRDHPVTEEEDFHTGMDIAAVEGRAILCALPGTVTEVGQSPIYGNYITVRHSENLETFYAHCSEIIAAVGMEIRQGERIAKVGQTGVTTGPHLHFSVLVAGQFCDPYWLLKDDVKLLDA
jgi:murein DD-endopeptidase MepM/ murein hydrolase activator NlpD